MNRQEFLNRLKETFNHFDNNECERLGRKFYGHPHLYLLHKKSDFDEEFERTVPVKDTYDKYDFYYVSNHLIKYFLNQYDSHTIIKFNDPKYLPIVFKMFDGHIYIVNGNDRVTKNRGMEVTHINGVDINTIISELDNIICYASNDYFYNQVAFRLSSSEILKSLPSIGNIEKIIYGNDINSIEFDLNNIDQQKVPYVDNNYKLDINGDTAIITYSSCSEEERMIELINKLQGLNNINYYIVDLRGNGGGNSEINKPLVDFLENKDTYVLSDERVFSSARMCLNDLKVNGATTFGKNPGTPISCFGNVVNKLQLDDLDLFGMGSVTYWYYDNNMKCHGIYKDSFDFRVHNNPEILDIKFFNVDVPIETNIEDFLNQNDVVLNTTLDYINNKNKLRK